ncbi:nuclear receptor subfamily 4 group A member 1-like [Ornithodoros turicata]|uniref:nuclear receptor subfamily 4 group A member 1-like n=1 Tax=Ornithodoros turicata TaxID=34597 RepID=UPI00313A2C4D
MSVSQKFCEELERSLKTPKLEPAAEAIEDSSTAMGTADQYTAQRGLTAVDTPDYYVPQASMDPQWDYNYGEYVSQIYDGYAYQQVAATGWSQQSCRYHPYGGRHYAYQTSQAPSVWYQHYPAVHAAIGDNCRGYVYDHGGSPNGSTGSPSQRFSPEASEDSGVVTPTDFSYTGYSPVQYKTVQRRTPRPKSEARECTVCLRPATGFHYNAATCDACKGFFRRVVALNKVYKCIGDGNCVAVTERSGCKACRMARCKAAGMDPTLVQAPFRQKTTAITARELDYPTLLALLQSPALSPLPADATLA